VITDKIYLVGFMGSGKSTVGRALAARLGWGCEDLDELVEAQQQRTIAEIFARHGEAYFRQAEREILHVLLPLRRLVVATGGGTFAEPDNRLTINRDGLSVWLDLPVEEIVRRVPLDGRRPLSGDRAYMERLYAARRVAYEQAHLRVDASGLAPADLVDRIVHLLP
jgi:shikimate kinase